MTAERHGNTWTICPGTAADEADRITISRTDLMISIICLNEAGQYDKQKILESLYDSIMTYEWRNDCYIREVSISGDNRTDLEKYLISCKKAG